MSKRKRQFLVLFLFSTFFVVAPLVLSFASGYRYSWTKNRIEKTGIIYVDAVPDEAEVWLNGKRVPRSLPVSVPRLLPEDYEVSVRLAGYLPWSKMLSVQSGQTTFAKTIHLLPDALPQLNTTANITKSAFSADGSAAAYLTLDEDWLELRHYDFTTGEKILFGRFGAEKFSATDLSMSEDGSHVLLNAIDALTGSRTVSLYSVAASAAALTVDELSATTELNYCWSNNNELIFSTGQKLISASAEDGQVANLFASGHNRIADLLCADNNYWLLIEDGGGEKLTRLNKDNPLLPEEVMTTPQAGYKFISGKEDLLWLGNERLKEGLAIKPADAGSFSIPFGTNLTWEFDNENGRVLLWNDYELFLIDFVQPRPVLLTRLGTPIRDVAWHPSGNYALFSTDTGITAIELDGRDRRNIYRLVEFSKVNSMTVDREGERLLFSGSIGQQRGLFERPL
jgi:hypothetical protein